MNWSISSAAKRLTFSLLVASAVGGCAVYEPYNPNGGTFADDAYLYEQPVYTNAPYYAPYYVAPSTSFGFRFESDRHRHQGFRGGDGFRGDRPGFRRDGLRGGRDGLQGGEPRRHQEGRVGDGGSGRNRAEAAPQQSSAQRNSDILKEIRELRNR